MLRFVPGFQYELLTEQAINSLLQSEFKVTSRANRMGVALSGDPVIPESLPCFQKPPATARYNYRATGTPSCCSTIDKLSAATQNPGRLFAATAEGWLRRDPVNESDSRHAPLRRRVALRGWNNIIWKRGCDEQS